MSDATTVIVYGPPGCGKTTNAEALRKKYGCAKVVDEFNPMRGLYSSQCFKSGRLITSDEMRGALILTNLAGDDVAALARQLDAIAIPFAVAMRRLEDAPTAPPQTPAYPAKTLDEMRTLHLQEVAEPIAGVRMYSAQQLLGNLSEIARSAAANGCTLGHALDMQLVLWEIQDRINFLDAELLAAFNKDAEELADPMPLAPPPEIRGGDDGIWADLVPMLKDMNARLSALEDKEACAW